MTLGVMDEKSVCKGGQECKQISVNFGKIMGG